jgi:hypothetical protein
LLTHGPAQTRSAIVWALDQIGSQFGAKSGGGALENVTIDDDALELLQHSGADEGYNIENGHQWPVDLVGAAVDREVHSKKCS